MKEPRTRTLRSSTLAAILLLTTSTLPANEPAHNAPSQQTLVLLLADKKDHGPPGNGLHDYPLWAKRWASILTTAQKDPTNQVPDTTRQLPNIHVDTAWHWPSPAQFQAADVIVAYCYLDWTENRLAQVRQYLEDGNGLVLIHSATWTKPEPSPAVAELTGVGGFKLYRHGPVQLKITATDHPICQGLPETITLEDDETYWPPTPLIDTATILATSVEEEGARGATPKAPQPMFWAYELGPGRVFGCVPGHRAETFDAPLFRTLLLRGIAWAANDKPSRWDPLTSANRM